MNKFIECRIVGKFGTAIKYEGVTYNLPHNEKFFAAHENPTTIRINVEKIISANLESHPAARLKKVERKRNFLRRLRGREPLFTNCLVLGDKYNVCRLVIDIGSNCETIYVNASAYDLLTAMTEKKKNNNEYTK